VKLEVKNTSGASVGDVEIILEVPEGDNAAHAVHETVVAHRAAKRAGTACTKTVGEVAGSNKKPWRQKGTGRARAGSHASPIWRGGGVVFGPKPRDYSKKVNKKVRKLALRKAFGERLNMGDVIVVDSLEVSEPKTKSVTAVLRSLGIDGTVLLIPEDQNRNLYLGGRNIPHLDIVPAGQVSTYNVLRQDKIVITTAALEIIINRVSQQS
jgi:large subunit ribosomal protein L4